MSLEYGRFCISENVWLMDSIQSSLSIEVNMLDTSQVINREFSGISIFNFI